MILLKAAQGQATLKTRAGVFLKISEVRRRIFASILCFTLFGSGHLFGQADGQLQWRPLNPLPVKNLSGIYAGESNGVLIAAGGSSPVGGKGGGKEDYHDQVFILEYNKAQWKTANKKLPFPIGYGISASYKGKVILAGGSDGRRYYNAVLALNYNDRRLQIDSLVSLPVPLANMSGAIVGDILFIAGGNTNPTDTSRNFFFALDLADREVKQWIRLEPWPGPSRISSVGASLSGKFFLFGGINKSNKDGSDETDVLNDAFSFTPEYRGSKLIGGKWSVLSAAPRGIAKAPNPAPTFGANHILFPGGEIKSLDGSKHGRLLAYHVASNTWVDFGKLPAGESNNATTAVKWNDQWVITGGRTKEGGSASKVFALARNIGFGWINWTALIVYLGFMIWIGFLFDKKREQTTKNFFTAGGRIPWWAAGISIFGTQLSAITFMATPAIVFATDWSLAIGTIMILLTVPIVVRYYIPFFRRLSVTSAYEYLEYRFNAGTRILGSISFILFQLGRMGIVLYLPAIAIASVTGINIYLVILIMGAVCTLYTVMGGIEAVIWTDVIQVIILMGGAILCLALAIGSVDGGLAGIISKGNAENKFTLVVNGWSSSKQVLWVVVIGFFFLNIIPYTSDQTIVQRYLTVKDEKAAAKSLWTNAIMALPTVPIFFGLGTALYVFYSANANAIPSEQVGEILPYFVVQQLPVGIAGVVIAGIFAASQSTLSASMNSISAAYLSDIHPRFKMNTSDKQNLWIAKLITIAVGVFGIGSAILVVVLNASFVFELFMEILGIMGGALAGVFFLGIFTTRANATGVIIGMICGVIVVWCAKAFTNVNVYLYGAISVVATFCAGYLASVLIRGRRQVEGLTYFTTREIKDVEAVKRII